jgi:phospholipid/cholesterol/gamma-HCH transport system substrate-binding protein
MTQRGQEVLIGVVVLIGLGLLGALIVLFGQFRGLFLETYPAYVTFVNASGIRSGTPVFITGVEVGAVTEVTLERAGVRLLLSIDGRHRLRQGCEVAIRRKGILADPYVEFTGGEPDTFLPTDGSVTLAGVVSPSVDDAAAELQALAHRLDTVLGDEQLQADFRSTLANVARFAGRGGELLDRAGQLTDELRRFVDQSNQLVLAVTALSQDARGQVEHQGANLDRLTASLVKNSEELNRSLQSAAEMLEDIRRGEGSVGKLLSEDRLYQQLVDTVVQVRQVVSQLGEMVTYFRQHPEVLVWGKESEKKEPIHLLPF